MLAPKSEPPADGETARQASARRQRNKSERRRWDRLAAEQCAKCGYARINVRHEMDPSTAPEGPAYYADMLGELHDFVERSP